MCAYAVAPFVADVERPSYIQEPVDSASLMRGVGAGDESAFNNLVRTYWGPVVAYVSPVVDDVDIARDIAQQTFWRIWERRGNWHGGSVRAYIFRVARNLSLDELRCGQARHRAELRSDIIEGKAPPIPLDLLEKRELIGRVDEHIQDLSPRRREALTLVYRQGLSYREAACIMNVSVKTIGNQLTVALGELRERMVPASTGSRADS